MKFKQTFNCIIIFCAAFILYYQTISFDIVRCDDYDIIKQFQHPEKIDSLFHKIFLSGYISTTYYRPIINLSFYINSRDHYYDFEPEHITNVLFHSINCVLIYFLFLNLLRESRLEKLRNKLSFTAGLIYAVHPLFTNSVAWIVGRNDLLLSFNCIISWLFLINYLSHSEKKPNNSSDKYKHWISYAFHNIFLFFAFLSKETAFLFPLILITYILLLNKVYNIKILISLIAIWLILYILYFYLKSISDLGEDVNRWGWDVIIMNLRIFPESITKFILPIDLSVLSTYNTFNTIAGIVLILIMTIVIMYKYKWKDPYVIFGIISYSLIIGPSILITLKNSHEWNQYLETRFYLAGVGMLLVIFHIVPLPGNLIYKKDAKKKIENAIIKSSTIRFYSIIFAFSSILAIMTFYESKNYRNPICFYESAIVDDSTRCMFYFILSKRYEAERMFDKIEKTLKKAIELCPRAKYYFELGHYYVKTGRYEEGITYFNKAIENDSNHQNSYIMLGNAYQGLSQYKKANEIYYKALEKWGEFPVLLDNLSYCSLRSGEINTAIKYASKMTDRKIINPQLSSDFSIVALQYKNMDSLYKKMILTALMLDSTNKRAKIQLKELDYRLHDNDGKRIAKLKNQ